MAKEAIADLKEADLKADKDSFDASWDEIVAQLSDETPKEAKEIPEKPALAPEKAPEIDGKTVSEAPEKVEKSAEKAEVSSEKPEVQAVTKAETTPPADEGADETPAIPVRPSRKVPEPEKIEEIPLPTLSEADKAEILKFEKEWEDSAPAVKILLKHQAAELEAKFGNTIIQLLHKLKEGQEPIVQTVQDLQYRDHMKTLIGNHPDYLSLVTPPAPNKPSKIFAWIEEQPTVVKKAWKTVYNEGNTDEMNELVSEYKKATGGSQASTGGAAAPGVTPAKPAPSKSEVAALKPVSSKRSVPQTEGPDPDDFNSAFDEFAEQVKLYRK